MPTCAAEMRSTDTVTAARSLLASAFLLEIALVEALSDSAADLAITFVEELGVLLGCLLLTSLEGNSATAAVQSTANDDDCGLAVASTWFVVLDPSGGRCSELEALFLVAVFEPPDSTPAAILA